MAKNTESSRGMRKLVSFVLGCFIVNTACATETVKLNIIYIMADELAYFEPGFMGGKELLTPNMDRLAKSGVIMKNILSGDPNCAPARATLLTGVHCGHNSVRDTSCQVLQALQERSRRDLRR